MNFDEDALEELSESIRRDGMQEPVIVRKSGGEYELVSGERRVRAAVMADIETVPAICRDVSDADMLKLGLIENIQREDLNPIELARAYKQLIEEFDWTQEELADQVGKKRVTVTNTLRLLNLPEVVQARVADGSLAMGHARALLAIESPEKQISACRKIVNQGLSVRQVEKLASRETATPKPKSGKDPNLSAVEDELRRKLGTKVALKPSGNTKGKIEIEYFNLDELDRLLELIRSIR
jgi:ParB family chromosome partitioning protein